MKKIKCSNCGKEHDETLSNCCWIDCECGKEICGRCGSYDLEYDRDRDDNDDDDDSNYWCNKVCSDCGLIGCGMCI